MDGFVHIAYNYAKGGSGSGNMTDDPNGQRAMGYYDQSFLNYYYYMASQFALSDRWFSPVASKSTPNRIATLTGGTTQGLVYDPFKNDNVGTQLAIPTIFSKLDKAGVSWRIYYGVTNGGCTDPDGDCGNSTLSAYPSITFADFTDSYKYLYVPATKGSCIAPTIPSGTAPVGDVQNAFCIDPTHIAPVSQYFTDVANGTLPSFAFVEPAYGHNDEHPGSGQSILTGQAQVASMVNALMSSPSWADSVFFLSYDEGGGPFDHVPPVPTHSNDFTSPTTGIAAGVTIPDIASIAVNPDTYYPCPSNGPVDPVTLKATPTLHCDLVDRGNFQDPGYNAGDAASDPALGGGGQGFAAQLGFRLPNMVISPFTRKHYVSHVPMDHTAVLKFVEDRFIKDGKYLTLRDAAQPNLLDFFDFVNAPWATPPAAGGIPTPTPVGATCTPATMQ
jgi:phospholipase C